MINQYKIQKKSSIIFSFFLAFVLFIAAMQTVEVEAATKKIHLSAATLQIDQGKTATLKLYNTKEKPKFKSSNPSVATVTKNGRVAGRNKGTATITVTLKNKKKYTCKVTVNFPKKIVNTEVEQPVFTQILELAQGATLQIPEDWGYELYEHNSKKIQYVCFKLPDDEQNGCIYVTAKPYHDEKVSMTVYATTTLKQLVKKQQDIGYLVQNAALGTAKTKGGTETGVLSFKSSKEGLTCHEVIFIQRKGKYVIFYECMSREPKVLTSYEPIALNMIDSLIFDDDILVQIP